MMIVKKAMRYVFLDCSCGYLDDAIENSVLIARYMMLSGGQQDKDNSVRRRH
jgi:hypothetical protein